MAKIIKFPLENSKKYGFRKARKKSKPNPEDYGQLNLFQEDPEAKIVQLSLGISPFEQALLLDESQDTRAIDLYKKTIEAGEHVADAYCNLGILFSHSGDRTKAVDNFTRSLKVDPRHFEAHYNLGNLYSDAGDLDLARLHYEIAITVAPEFPNSFYNLGLVLAVKKEFKSAIEAFTKFRELAEEGEKSNADDVLASLKQTMINQA